MNWIEEHPISFFIALAVLIVAGVSGVALWGAHNEASSFRKLTGRSDVSTWDALWVQLRVDCR